MDSGWDSWLFAASQWGIWLVQLAIRSTLLILILEALVLLNRGFSASARHLCRTLALSALLAVPCLALALPALRVPLLESPLPVLTAPAAAVLEEPVGRTTVQVQAQAAPVQPDSKVSRGTPTNVEFPRALPGSAPIGRQVPGPRPAAQSDWTELGTGRLLLASLTPVWGLVALLLFVRLLVGLVCVRVARWQAERVEDGPLYERMSQVADRLDFSQPIRLFVSSRTEVALSVGILRPAVMLPSIASTWSEGRLTSILLHELSHAKRRDNLSNLISEVACSVYWFNPIVWRAASALKVDRERACDDRVLRAGTRASDYAGHLLEVARAVAQRRFWGALEVSQSSVLKDRFQALLNPNVNRRTLSDAGFMGVFSLILLLTLSVSTVHPWKVPTILQPGDSQMAAAGGAGPLASEKLRRRALSEEAVDSDQGDDSLEEESSAPVAVSTDSSNAGTRSFARKRVPSRGGAGKAAVGGQGIEKPSVDPGRGNSRRLKDVSRLLAQTPRADRNSNLRRRLALPSIGRIGAVPTQRVQLEDPTLPGDSGNLGGDVPDGDSDPQVVEIASFDLGTLGEDSRATDINDAGIVVGQSRTAKGIVHPFLWVREIGIVDVGEEQDVHTRAVRINSANQVLCETFDTFVFRGYVWSAEAGLKDLGALNPDSALTVPQAISESGNVVGSSRGAGDILKAFFWSPESGILDIGAPGWSEALDLNEKDEVVGHADNRAFIWSRDDGFVSLGPDDSEFSTATAINNLGQVVGWARYAEDEERAFLWTRRDGLVDLGVLSPDFPLSLAYQVSDAGVVIGHSLSRPSAQVQQEVRAFRWSLETGMASLGESPMHSRVAMNSLGHVVGTNFPGQVSNNPLAFLWTEEGRVTLTPTPQASLSSEAVALNNRGQIAGNTFFSPEESRAFLWEVRFVSSQSEND